MSSTVIVAVGAAALLGPVGLGLVLGAGAVALFASTLGTKDAETAEHMISEAWQHTSRELKTEAAQLPNEHERERIATSIDNAEASYRKAVADGDSSRAGQVINGIREEMCKLHAKASRISLEGMEEDRVSLPPVNDEADTQNASLLEDICDFGMRLSSFGQAEADKARPLILEAKEGAGTFRLRAIRDEIKAAYGALCEREALTRMFRQDCTEFLAAMKHAQGTETLCATIEELLRAGHISRESYNEVYKAVCAVFQSQAESIIDTLLTSRVDAELAGMGYELLDDAGTPVKLTEGKIHTLDTPYEGYKLRVKVGEDHTVATRLVRMAESEKEQSSASEYQKQQDIETARKICTDLNRFHESLRNEGLIVTDLMRKEPGQENIDVVVSKSDRRKKRTTTTQQQHMTRYLS